MKRLFGFLLALAVVSFAIVSCKDDFNEEEFLKLQSQLRLEQDAAQRERDAAAAEAFSEEIVQSYIDAQNAAGDLLGVTIIVREDDTPVSGVSVTISSGAGQDESGRTAATVSGTTDASGTVVFDRVVIANSTVSLSKAGYFSASARVDFGNPPAPTTVQVPNPSNPTQLVNKYIAPEKTFVNLALPVFSESDTEGNTAVIQGVFSIQNDLTNDPNTRDVLPDGLEVAANIADALIAAGGVSSSCFCVADYRFSGAAGSLGVAAIDPVTGEFSMRVPATSGGLNINLIYPTITGTQRLAVRRLNGQDIAPEFRDVPTVWSPNGATNGIPAIPGAKAVFNAPPAPGRGFNITTFAPIARALETGSITATGDNTLTNTTYNLVSRGSGYSSSPAVAITGGGGTGATATSSLRGFVTSANISNGGTGYAASAFFDVQFTYTDANGNAVVYATIEDVQASAGGVLPTGALTLPNAAGFAGNATPFTTSQGTQGFGVRVVDANTSNVAAATTTATIAVTQSTELNSITITNGGSGFTSAPTIAVTGGGTPTAQASVVVNAFRSRFSFTLPTTGTTTPYKVVPSAIRFTYASNGVDAQVVEADGKVDRLNNIGNAASSNVDLVDELTTDGTNLIAINSGLSFRTTRFWTSAPTVTVIDATIQQAAANLTISAAGEVTAIIDPDVDAGTDVNLLIPASANTVVGQGYDAMTVAIEPTITGAPGSGAVYQLDLANNVTTKVVTWSSLSTKVSGGSGYLQNLNRTNAAVAYNPPANVVVQTGKIYQLTINAGTGEKLENVQN